MKLTRYKQNPILAPRKINRWESGSVFNCGVADDGTLVHMLYRAIGKDDKNYVSRLGYAVSNDGINFERKDKPVFVPKKPYKWGCEDPRITKIGDMFYITCVVLSKPALKCGGPPKTALIMTKDFKNFKRYGVITPEGVHDKDVVLFPKLIDGRYVMLHRPHDWTKKGVKRREAGYFPKKPSIWIADSPNLKHWTGHRILMEPQERWESKKIGAGSPPLKTKKGWLLFYHGVDENKTYSAGAALLDLKDPTEILARSRYPILKPEMKYEKEGYVPNVVFPTGTIVRENEIFVYYGAADTSICLAKCSLDELVDSLLENNKKY